MKGWQNNNNKKTMTTTIRSFFLYPQTKTIKLHESWSHKLGRPLPFTLGSSTIWRIIGQRIVAIISAQKRASSGGLQLVGLPRLNSSVWNCLSCNAIPAQCFRLTTSPRAAALRAVMASVSLSTVLCFSGNGLARVTQWTRNSLCDWLQLVQSQVGGRRSSVRVRQDLKRRLGWIGVHFLSAWKPVLIII